MRNYDYSISLTSQFYFCGVPFRLDTSPKCSINCLYCFAMTRGGRRTSRSLIADPEQLRRKLDRLGVAAEHPSDITGQLLVKKVPIHFGGMSDPFSTSSTTRVSREMLGILADNQVPTIISTKNTDALTDDQTLKILERMHNVVIQISISSASKRSTALIEPNAPTAAKRLGAISTLSSLGKHVIVRLQPLIPWLMKENEHELIPQLASSGAKHVIVEFLKLPVEKVISHMTAFFRATSWNGYEFYGAAGSRLVGREWLLPTEYKWEALQPIIGAIRSCGMTYGAADYGLNHLGDTACCCGVDGIDGFENWFHGNLSNVIRLASVGYLTVCELKKYWYPEGTITRVMNSNSRIDNQHGIRDYLIEKWNSPGTINAPNEYLGISWEGDYDGEGNCVYYKASNS